MKQKDIFPVLDMMCAACANSVENALSKADGVFSAHVNYASQKATVEYNPEVTTAQKLRQIVIDAGYDMLTDQVSEADLNRYKQENYQKLKNAFVGSLFCSLPIFFISMLGLRFPYSPYFLGILAGICLIFFGKRFFVGAFKQLRHKTANMDTLVAMSTGVAFLYSWFTLIFEQQWKALGLNTHLYFEASTMIISFVLLGKLLEESAKRKTFEAIESLMGLKPESVWIFKHEKWEEIPLEKVQINDVILVKSGQKIAVDGSVLSGSSFVDESMITGEPMGVRKGVGDSVFAGTTNQEGSFEMKAERIGAQTLLSNIIKAVEQAQSSKPPVQKLVDKISAIFVPTVIAIATLSWILWGIFAPQNGFSLGLQSFVTVLVIACPCALGLATPTAIMVGVGKAAKNGILVKDAQSLETASKITDIVLDKTGTITQGKPRVAHSLWVNKNRDLPILLGLEKHSVHPLAKAIWEEWKNITPEKTSDFQEIVGFGVQAEFQQKKYRAGSLAWSEKSLPLPQEWKNQVENWKAQGTVIALSDEQDILAVLCISDSVKNTSALAISQLQKMGVRVHMLTGDTPQSAQNIAQQVGITSVLAQTTPQEKQSFIQKLQKEGKTVAMVGDGINDSQALAQADMSIAMGQGSDVAMEVAQITLISSDLMKLPITLKLSQQTLTTIRQNLFWAFIYNLIGIPIAAGALYPFFHFLLNPMIGAMAMALSSVSVVTNSLLLKRKKI